MLVSNNPDDESLARNETDSTVTSLDDDESVVDVSGQSLELSLLGSLDLVKGLCFFRNAFNLIPKSIGGLGGLEYLQAKISSSGFSDDLAWDNLKGLKELEL